MSEGRFWNLVSQLRENYRVGAHTRGPCSNNDCSNSSDGGGKCGECCARELGELIGDHDLAEIFKAYIKATQGVLADMLESLKDAG